MLLIGLGMLAYNHVIPTTISNHALILSYDTIEKLEESSDLIVVVTVAGKGRQEAWVIGKEYGSKRYTTFTPVRVDQVFKGDVRPGDIIEVAEPIGYERQPWGLYYMARDGYIPVQQNSTYLLFLGKSESGSLFATGLEQGKFVWPPPQTLSAESLEITKMGGHYQDLFDAVVAKYGPLSNQ